VKCIVVSVVVGFWYMSFSMCASSDDCEVEKIDVAVGL